MKLRLLTLTLVGVSALSGCMSTEELGKYITTKTYHKGVQLSQNGNPVITGNKPVVNPEVQPTDSVSAIVIDKPISYTAHKLDATYPVNIDPAARAIKREFRFYSPKDLKRLYGTGAETEMVTSYWRYEADAGHYYQMRNYVSFGTSRNVVDIEMFPVEDGVRIITTYWVEAGDTVERKKVKDAIREKINNAVLPYT